ncbi:MAG: Stp1/IreP family PP2C-type Ser/Thr phosphatase [Acidobacteria bacterium]|nr:Stp1/IreP family PP2C-type Ser/Thr phosphatase [Acidobacteriota bacterium]
MFTFLKKILQRNRINKPQPTDVQLNQAAASVDDAPAPSPPLVYDVTASFLSDVGCQRQINEDSGRYITPADPALLSDKGMLFVVADGMGGHSGGEIASRLAVEVIPRTYYQTSGDVQEALQKAILEANHAIFDEAFKDRTLYGMGTTCTALVLKDGKAFAAHVGDSRLYLVRNDDIYLLTEDHSAVMQMVRRGLLNLQQARHHPDKNIILRALGSHATVEITTWKQPLPVRLGDQFLLCSDGLYDLVEDAEIKNILVANEPHTACEKLIALAKQRGGHDNITVGIVSLEAKNADEPKPLRETREAEVWQ